VAARQWRYLIAYPGSFSSDSDIRANPKTSATGGGVRSLLEVWNEYSQRLFVARAERRYAKVASSQLLELYRQERRGRPELNRRALYQSIVAQRLGPQSGRSGEIVRRAEESFTDWPSDRELKFRDVVHYLIFDEYVHLANAREGTRTNMGVVVGRIIPDDI
jgi:hypothetical protein